MNTLPTWETLFRRWRELTHAEAAAIASESWDSLGAVQEEKRRLQPLVDERWASSGQPVARLRLEAAELFELERSNHEMLDRRLEALGRQQSELSQRSRVLRQIHRHYGGAAVPAWQSYS